MGLTFIDKGDCRLISFASLHSSKLDSRHRIKKASHICERLCASGGNRTRTGVAAHRILSPACLPVPPPRRLLKDLKKNPNRNSGFLSERPGSNRPPRPWQGRALPNELLSLVQELFLGVQK
jgi:hypothetical protein